MIVGARRRCMSERGGGAQRQSMSSLLGWAGMKNPTPSLDMVFAWPLAQPMGVTLCRVSNRCVQPNIRRIHRSGHSQPNATVRRVLAVSTPLDERQRLTTIFVHRLAPRVYRTLLGRPLSCFLHRPLAHPPQVAQHSLPSSPRRLALGVRLTFALSAPLWSQGRSVPSRFCTAIFEHSGVSRVGVVGAAGVRSSSVAHQKLVNVRIHMRWPPATRCPSGCMV